MSYVLGMNAKLYYGDSGSTPSTELTTVKNVQLELTAGEADVTTRGNSGWRATQATLKEATLTFDLIWDPTEAGFTALRNAYLNSSEIALMPLDQEDGEGPDADWTVTGFSRNEDLEEAITVSVTAKLSTFRSWQEAS